MQLFKWVGSMLLLVLALACCNRASAQSCGYNYGYSYQAPVYQAPQVQYVDRPYPVEFPIAYPVPFSVAVPVVSYLYNGGGNYAPVYQAQTMNPMPGVQTQQPQQQQSFSATDAQLEALAMRIEERIMAKLEARLSGQPVQAQAQQQQNYSSPPPAVPDDIVAELHREYPQATGKAKSCADCHTGRNAAGGVMIFNTDGSLNEQAPWAQIFDAVDKFRMPPGAKSDKSKGVPDQVLSVFEAKAKAK